MPNNTVFTKLNLKLFNECLKLNDTPKCDWQVHKYIHTYIVKIDVSFKALC